MTSGKDRKTHYPQGNGPGDSFLDNQFSIDCDEDFMVMSIGMYKFFLANGKDGLEAKQLYDHLLFAARVQGSKKVKANLSYIKKGLGWGTSKTKKAKAFLRAAGLIVYSQEKDDSGQFDGQRIILKSSWDIESLKSWIEKREQREAEKSSGGSEIEPPVEEESTGGSEIEPVEHMGSSKEDDAICPVGQFTDQRSTVPPVTSDNYKGSYKKERGGYNYNDNSTSREGTEPETPPPAPSQDKTGEEKKGLFSEVQTRIRYITGNTFRLSPKSQELIRELTELQDSAYILQTVDQLLDEKRNKPSPWIARYANEDLQERLGWCIRTQAAKQKSFRTHHVSCPCCNSVFTGTNTACSSCGFEVTNIDDPEKIKDHMKWMESREKVSPYRLEEDGIDISIEDAGPELKVNLQIHDLQKSLTGTKGLKPGREPVEKVWSEILVMAEHWARHTKGIHSSMAMLHLRSHIEAVSKLPEEAFFPKQKELFHEAG